MADTVDGRRKRVRPERAKPMHPEMQAELDALKAAHVPQAAIARALSRRYRSVAAQREALRSLRGKQSGEHARDINK